MGENRKALKLKIVCHPCGGESKYCRLVTGQAIYPHRPDLWGAFFWRCDTCGGYVGTHANSPKHAPLGEIVSEKVKRLRIEIHAELDQIWKGKLLTRAQTYQEMSRILGYRYHTGNVTSEDQARGVMAAVKILRVKLETERAKR